MHKNEQHIAGTYSKSINLYGLLFKHSMFKKNFTCTNTQMEKIISTRSQFCFRVAWKWNENVKIVMTKSVTER